MMAAFVRAGLLLLALLMGLFFLCSCAARGPQGTDMEKWWEGRITRQISSRDMNLNGFSDTDDLIEGGRREVKRQPYYRSRYIENRGYPPPSEGVCTDLVWRAYANAGYNLKAMIDLDISLSPKSYPRVNGQPNPNIDFRRVPNMKVFFERYGKSLTTQIKPNDAANLAQWQAGDIAIFKDVDHVAIVSPRRNAQGVPYLIHNPGPRPLEADDLWALYQQNRLTGHYRFPKE